jgi:hypothetical protein
MLFRVYQNWVWPQCGSVRSGFGEKIFTCPFGGSGKGYAYYEKDIQPYRSTWRDGWCACRLQRKFEQHLVN